MYNKLKYFTVLVFIVSLASAQHTECPEVNFGSSEKVRIHSLSDPSSLNPYNAYGELATYMAYQVHMSLYGIDFHSYDLIPVLATKLPVYTERADGLFNMQIEIRPEAKWDNGTSITGYDVAFSLKVMKAPQVDNRRLKPYFDFIKGIEVSTENEKKFTLVIQPYMIAEVSLTELYIIPHSIYDPSGILNLYSVNDLETNSEALNGDEQLEKFAGFFNSDKFKRQTIAGCGPYTFEGWQSRDRVTFNLKKDWWGHQLADINHRFEAYANVIEYVIVPDLFTATQALKNGRIDAMRSINPRDFVEDLQSDPCVLEQFTLSNPPMFSYDYIGLNLKDPKLGDAKTREALSYLMNTPQLIDSFCYGLGEVVTTPIHPSIESRLNQDIKAIPYDLDKAKTLLHEAGWTDSNSDGILDKDINGNLEDFYFTIGYNNGNDRRKTAALIFQEGCRKAGIKVNVEVWEWAVLLERVKNHDFQAYIGGWISSPLESDPKQIWHTDSYNGGSNYTGFGSEYSDKIIEDLRAELDQERRNQLHKDLQAAIREELPYIFLLTQKERVAIHNKYSNAYASGIRPGFWANGFRPK